MSAYIPAREHIALLVTVAMDGPRGRAVSPNNAWHSFTWYASDPQAVSYSDGPETYFARLEAIRRRADHETADRTGQMLTDAVVHSVATRYPDDTDATRPGTYIAEGIGDWTAPYIHDYRAAYRPTAVEALKAIDGYEYQACEADDWSGSEAERFCDSLRRSVIGHLPGYDEAPWSWDIEDIEKARAVAV